MIKDIKYGGYSATPSDYECADGDLAAALNVVPDNGNLAAVLPSATVLKFYTTDDTTDTERCNGFTVIYEHQTTSYTHYIIYDPTNKKLYWIDANSSSLAEVGLSDLTELDLSFDDDDALNDINAIGNTLMIFTEQHIYYFLWTNGKYKALGDHIPTLNVSFGLRGKPRLWSHSKASETDDDTRGTFTFTFDGISEDKLYEEWTEDNQSKITSAVMAKVNKFLAEQSVDAGRFCLPFFVRYALRLYDGSLTHHSAPILMNPTTKAAPIVFWHHVSGKNKYTEAECDIMLVSSILDYRVINDDEYFDLKTNWTDIVKSVDIFISKPIYTYDQSGYCTSFADTDNFETKFIGALDFDAYANSGDPQNDKPLLPLTITTSTTKTYTDDDNDGTIPVGKESPLGSNYCEWPYSRLYALYFSDDRSYPSKTINLPEYSDEKNIEKLKDVSAFYFIESIDIEDLADAVNSRVDIEIDDEYMQSLSSREVMDDDYLSHDRLMAEHSHVYNSRLNLSGVKRELFCGFKLESMLAYVNNTSVSWYKGASTIGFSDYGSIDTTVEVYIKEDGLTYYVSAAGTLPIGYLVSDTVYPSAADESAKTNGFLAKRSWPCYFYYPNNNAYKMFVYSTSVSPKRIEIDLTTHDFLNGAYAVLDYETERTKFEGTMLTTTGEEDNIIDVPSKLYTSDTNNPFRFDVTNINTIGTGRILGIATAAKALSQGQFGEYPLYAFTTEGVWAMTVSSSTGAYSAVQPFTRDVPIKDSDGDYNVDCITQIDSAVLFASDRGVMLISGSDSSCISDVLNGKATFSYSSLPGAETLITNAGFSTEQFEYASFLTFLRDCGMLYDYTHQRIIVYNPNYSYAYVYSMKDKAWGMMASTIQSGVNSYPEALAMLSDGSLVNLCEDDTDEDGTTTALNGILFTRPFKFGDANLLKTVDTIIQRGYFEKSHVQQVLYGSRDLSHWYKVWSSTDKYLRGFYGTPYKYFRLAVVCQLDSTESLYGFTAQFTPRLTNKPR